MAKQVTVNKEQRLYVIPEGSGYSCLGFDVAFNRTLAIRKELGLPCVAGTDAPSADNIGTLAGYAEYTDAEAAAREYHYRTGKRLECELTPQLIGLEGKRVEVIDRHGDKRRFQVGRSTGWMPIHLEIARRTSHGGVAVTGAPFQSVTIIR